MTQIMLVFWVIIAFLILKEQKIARILIYLGVFSLIAAVCYMLLGSPDVAMAEAATNAFTVVFFIICFEKYFNFTDAHMGSTERKNKLLSVSTLLPAGLTFLIFGLFIYFRPDALYNPYLRDRFVQNFTADVGGYNPVTAIYLGYRVYDTLFEALVVVLAVVAVTHLSAFSENIVPKDQHSEMESSGLAVFAIKVICPIMIIFGIYLVLNGHITPGGGFQGGLAAASFFICRYMIYDVNDLPINKLNRMEELIFIGITLFAVLIVFFGAAAHLPPHLLPIFQRVYLILMNALIGLKVACGFVILFYRFIVIEQR